MSEAPPPPPRRKPDIAGQTGRIAGRIVGGLGARLLRTKPVREAVRRAHEEATRPDPEERPPPPS
jgi:hypothetical protein